MSAGKLQNSVRGPSPCYGRVNSTANASFRLPVDPDHASSRTCLCEQGPKSRALSQRAGMLNKPQPLSLGLWGQRKLWCAACCEASPSNRPLHPKLDTYESDTATRQDPTAFSSPLFHPFAGPTLYATRNLRSLPKRLPATKANLYIPKLPCPNSLKTQDAVRYTTFSSGKPGRWVSGSR